MESQLNHYGALIEKIRKDRKLSREELCEGIMSKRNYQRFATGEVSISSDKIHLITDKLMLDTYSLQEIYKIDNQDEYQKLKKAFNLVSQWSEIEANTILATINYDDITSKVNKQIYDFTNLLIKKGKNTITDIDYTNKVETLIGFPGVLNKKILNSVELSGLFVLMAKQSKSRNTQIVKFLINLIHNQEATSYWITNEIKTGIYANVTKGLYHLQQYQKCFIQCLEGLEVSEKTRKFIGLVNLLGYKALSLNKLGRFEEALETAVKLYMHVLVEGNNNKITFVKNTLNQNLKINIEEVLLIKKEE